MDFATLYTGDFKVGEASSIKNDRYCFIYNIEFSMNTVLNER